MITNIIFDCELHGEVEVQVEWGFLHMNEEILSPEHIFIEEVYPECVRKLLGDGVIAFKVCEAIQQNNEDWKLEREIERKGIIL